MSFAARFGGALHDTALRDLVAGGPVTDAVSAAQAARLGHYCRAMGGEAGPARWSAPDTDPPMLARALAQDIMDLHGVIGAPDIHARLNQMRARAWSRVLAATPKPLSRADVPPRAQVRAARLVPAYFGFFRYDTLDIAPPRFGGAPGPDLAREVYVGVDAALVLPYDPASDRVLLVEQFRVGLWRRGDPQPWSLEPVAGLVDPGEDPADTARREAAEEAGLRLGALERVAGGYASPGYSTDYFHMFVAFCDLPDGLHGGIGGAPGESENIRSHILPFAQAMQMLDSGEIDVVPLQVMLLWLARWRAGQGR